MQRDDPPESWAKIAVFVCGDHNIFFPSLVALASVEEKNPGRFDKFICFDGARVTPSMRSSMQNYGIQFLDSKSIPNFEEAVALRPMTEGNWPVEIFLNWALPEHLVSLGYKYSIKLDYDTLALRPFSNLEDFTGDDITLAAMKINNSTHVPPNAASRICAETGLQPEHKISINVGVCVFNNIKSKEWQFFRKFRQVYSILVEECPDERLLEQVCFAILVENLGSSFRRLDNIYNFRVKRAKKGDFDSTRDAVIAHYINRPKPWNPLSAEQMIELTQTERYPTIFFRHCWLEYAQKFDGFEKFCEQRPLSAAEILCMRELVKSREKIADLGAKLIKRRRRVAEAEAGAATRAAKLRSRIYKLEEKNVQLRSEINATRSQLAAIRRSPLRFAVGNVYRRLRG